MITEEYTFPVIKNNSETIDLIFQKSLDSNSNVQGSVGIFGIGRNSIIKDDDYEEGEVTNYARDYISNEKTNLLFYKYGKNGYNCTLSRHEYSIAEYLMEECPHLPNFIRPALLLKNSFINPDDKNGDLFNVRKITKKTIVSDIALFEYIKDFISLHDFLKKYKSYKHVIDSIFIQLCLALYIAREKCRFVHNDLHSTNIIIKRCDPDTVFLYKIKRDGEEIIFNVNSFGWFPIIIDYGMSYTDNCKGFSLETIDLDHYGIITYRFDKLSDIIRMSTVFASSRYNPILSRFIFSVLEGLPINFKTTFENITKYNSAYSLRDDFIVIYKEFFGTKDDFQEQCFVLIHRCITLPLKPCPEGSDYNLEDELRIFFKNWSIIESTLLNAQKVFLFRVFTDCKIKRMSVNEIKKNIRDDYENLLNAPLYDHNIDWGVMCESFSKIVSIFSYRLYITTTDLYHLRKRKLYTKLGMTPDDFLFSMIKIVGRNDKYLKTGQKVLYIDDTTRSNAHFQIEESMPVYEVLKELERAEEEEEEEDYLNKDLQF